MRATVLAAATLLALSGAAFAQGTAPAAGGNGQSASPDLHSSSSAPAPSTGTPQTVPHTSGTSITKPGQTVVPPTGGSGQQ